MNSECCAAPLVPTVLTELRETSFFPFQIKIVCHVHVLDEMVEILIFL